MKKILIAILATTMILTVSIVSAINTTNKNTKDEESPLYTIRTNGAINEKNKNIKTRFFGNRIFFLPFKWQRNTQSNIRLVTKANQKYDCKPTFDDRLTCYSGCTIDLCTINPTALCGICTKGIICSTMFGKC